MARKTFVELVDDLDGGKAEETVTFSLDGVSYEIDLSEKNATTLREEIGAWTEKARRVGGRRTRSTGGSSSRGSSDSARIREWARENGYDVPDRGRVAGSIRQAYEEANAS